MNIGSVTKYLSAKIPPALQESYDNSGLLVGDVKNPLTGIIINVDVTEAVVEEAIAKGCNLIVCHHPIVFKGLKRFVGQDYVSRTVEKAIKNDIAIYAAHTNLDSVDFGVSKLLAQKVGLENTKVLDPKNGLLKKLVVFCPTAHAEKVREAIFDAGAGYIGNYDSCSFNAQGQGSFRGGENTTPFVGKKGQLHFEPETRIETVFPSFLKGAVVQALLSAHSYEEVAYDIYPLENTYPKAGLGMIGDLPQAMEAKDFLLSMKAKLHLEVIKHTELDNRKVSRVAVCGGSGSFLIHAARSAKADIYLTGDLKYHEFFDAEDQIILADIGHYESEKYTKELLYQIIIEKFPNFAPTLSEVNTNPVNYL